MALRQPARGGTGPLSDSALTTKLEGFTKLSGDDRLGLVRAISNVRVVEARRDLAAEGERPGFVHVVLDGWAAAYKSLSDGKRQIVGFFVPGDICDANVFVLARMDHSIGAVTRLKVAMISISEMARLTLERPRLTQALWWEALVTSAVRREWILSIGQRNAYGRIGHLLIELYLRLKAVGRVQESRCDFPLTQNDLADATGLTAVHVNRTLQDLRRDGLIELERKQLKILDLARLMDVTMFNPNYLHLDHEGRHLDANV
jgi:CRP-like cAMP-binding protein